MDEPTSTPVVPAALVFADQVLDGGSFRSWDEPPQYRDDGASYADDLARARARSGADEAAITGEGRIGGHRVAVLLSEFTFLAARSAPRPPPGCCVRWSGRRRSGCR